MKNFNKFDDIPYRWLKAYNRYTFSRNLREDQGIETQREYLESFSPQDRLDMAFIYDLLLKKGRKHIQDVITQGIEFTDEDYVESRVA